MTQWRVDTFDALTAGDAEQDGAKTVLVVTDDLEAVGKTGKTLIHLGYRVQVALAIDGLIRGMPKTAPEAVLIQLDALEGDTAAIAAALHQHVESPLVPMIGYLRGDADCGEGLDSVLFHPCHPRQIAGRVDAMIRLQAMQFELLRRNQILKLRGVSGAAIPEMSASRSIRVLFIGKAKPEFMVILDAMRGRNVEVVAAFTSFTAFDYLHGREFDAVVIDAMDSAEPAQSILDSMRRNVRLLHVPKLCLVRRDTASPCPQALLDAATDVIAATDAVEEITNRILEPASYHLIHSGIRAAFDALGDADSRDPDTGLYSRDFLETYLDFLANEGEPRQVCVVRLVPRAHFAIDEVFVRVAVAQAGGLLSGLVRINDLVARLSDDSFAIALPPMRERDLLGLANRVREVLEAAAFESGSKEHGAFSLDVDVSVEESRDALPAATRVSKLLAA